jgi:arylsulfatase A-like enzyme|eukprot:COSAG01_NODE_1008_length_12157_cov_17.425029_6_plen_51_part_00
MTVWEHSLRVPLIIAVPWLLQSHGKVHVGMAEMVDFCEWHSFSSALRAVK